MTSNDERRGLIGNNPSSAFTPIAQPVPVTSYHGTGPVSPTTNTEHQSTASLFVASLHALSTVHFNTDETDGLSYDSDHSGGYDSSNDPDLQHLASETNEPGPNSFKLYRERWTMLGIFCLFSASNAMEWLTYSPISDIFTFYFGVSSFSVHILSILFMIIYICASIPAGKFMKEYGLKYSLCFSAGLNITGSFLKLLPWPFLSGFEYGGIAYFFAVFGTILCGAAQLFILSAPVLIAQAWFGSHERVTATAIGTAANSFGWAAAFALVPAVLGSHSSEVGESYELAREVPVQYLLLVHFLLVSGAGYLVLKYFEAAPPTPPSFSAAAALSINSDPSASPVMSVRSHSPFGGRPAVEQMNVAPIAHETHFIAIVNSALEDRAFALIVLTFGILSGLNYALVVLLSSILSESDYPTGFISLCGVAAIVCGLFSNLALGVLADRIEIRRYKKLMIWLALGIATGTMFLFAIVPILPSNSNTFVLFVMVVLGFALNAPEAVLMDLAVENTYPAPSEITTQFLLVMGNCVGIVLILFISFIQELSLTLAGFLLVGLLLGPTIIWRTYSGQHKRYEAELTQQRLADLQVGFTPSHSQAAQHPQPQHQTTTNKTSETNNILETSYQASEVLDGNVP